MGASPKPPPYLESKDGQEGAAARVRGVGMARRRRRVAAHATMVSRINGRAKGWDRSEGEIGPERWGLRMGSGQGRAQPGKKRRRLRGGAVRCPVRHTGA